METWKDIVAEMMELSKKDALMWSPQEYLSAYSQRFKLACKTLEDENKKLNDVLRPILDCKWTMLASKHGTEVGDDPEFDQLCDLIWMAQRKMIGGTE